MKLRFLFPPPSWALRFGRKFVTLESCRSHDLLSHNVSSAVVTLHSWKVGLEYLNMQQIFLFMRVVVRGQGSSCKEHFLVLITQSTGQKEREKDMSSRYMQLTQLVPLIITPIQWVSVNFWAQHNALLAPHES